MTRRGKSAKSGKSGTKPAPEAKARPPAPRRKAATQVAAVCVDAACTQVLLITSRGTGRWIVPKGWPMRKKSLPGTALQEAWEEAGVEGQAGKKELGRFHYEKLREHGFAIPVDVRVFPVAVSALKESFPEAGQRKRQWFPIAEAAELVSDEGLRPIIRALPQHVAAGLVPAAKGKK